MGFVHHQCARTFTVYGSYREMTRSQEADVSGREVIWKTHGSTRNQWSPHLPLLVSLHTRCCPWPLTITAARLFHLSVTMIIDKRNIHHVVSSPPPTGFVLLWLFSGLACTCFALLSGKPFRRSGPLDQLEPTSCQLRSCMQLRGPNYMHEHLGNVNSSMPSRLQMCFDTKPQVPMTTPLMLRVCIDLPVYADADPGLRGAPQRPCMRGRGQHCVRGGKHPGPAGGGARRPCVHHDEDRPQHG